MDTQLTDFGESYDVHGLLLSFQKEWILMLNVDIDTPIGKRGVIALIAWAVLIGGLSLARLTGYLPILVVPAHHATQTVTKSSKE